MRHPVFNNKNVVLLHRNPLFKSAVSVFSTHAAKGSLPALLYGYRLFFKRNVSYVKIYKSPRKFVKLANVFRVYSSRRKYLFLNSYRFVRSARFGSIRFPQCRIIRRKSPVDRAAALNFQSYAKRLRSNWFFLTGGLLATPVSSSTDVKKWIRRKLNLELFINNRAHPSFLSELAIAAEFKRVLKKLFVNNFYYFARIRLNFGDFSSLARFANKPNLRTNRDWLLVKPYLFLNCAELSTVKRSFANSTAYRLYRNYTRVFGLAKRTRTRPKKAVDTLFRIIIKTARRFRPITVRKTLNLRNYLRDRRPLFKFSALRVTRWRRLKRAGSTLWRRARLSNFRLVRRNILIAAARRNCSRLGTLPYLRVAKAAARIRLGRRFKKFNLWLDLLNLSTASFRATAVVKRKLKISRFFLQFESALPRTRLPITHSRRLFNTRPLVAANLARDYRNSNIFKNLSRPVSTSKEKTAFLFNAYGFIFVTDGFSSLNDSNRTAYIAKKILYSFVGKNELQRYILKRYARLHVSYGKKVRATGSDFAGLRASNRQIFDSNRVSGRAVSIALARPAFLTWSNSERAEGSDFNIKRVRFKPGYSTQWRDARRTLQESMNLNFRYQYRLTRYLAKYKKFIKFKTYVVQEMRLANILVRSRFFNDENQVMLFIRDGLVFLNGVTVFNQFIQVVEGDFIQLVVNIKYYIIYRWFSNWVLKKRLRLRKVMRKKFSNRYDFGEKQRSRRLPAWVRYSKNAIGDIPHFLEVDYFTLSTFVLREPERWFELSPYSVLGPRFSVINMYNWKYIN